MKKDLATAIITALVGVILAYFIVGGVFLKEPKPVTIKTLSTSVDNTVPEPNPEIFNYRAINPTVETYVDCKNYDASGACLDGGN